MKATLLLVLICLATCCFGQKKQRLIAIAEWGGLDTLTVPVGVQMHLIDSVYFTYGGSRHSTFDYNAMDYADLGNMYENQSSILSKVYGIMIPNNVDSADYTLNIAFDSMYYFGMNGPLEPTQIGALQYYPDGMPKEAYNTSYYSPSAQFVRYFGRLTFAKYRLAPLWLSGRPRPC